jgi:hypothetical protein
VGVLQDMENYFSGSSWVQQLGYTSQNLLNALHCFCDIKQTDGNIVKYNFVSGHIDIDYCRQ